MTCTAPECNLPARYRVEGTDDNEDRFVEFVCGCALGYLCEGDPDAKVTPLKEEAL